MPVDDSPYYRSGGTQPEYWEPVEPDVPALRSAAREILGYPAVLDPDAPIDVEPPRPQTMRELDRYDEIVALGRVEELVRRKPLRRVRGEHLMVVKWLDRFGCMTTEQLHRAVLPGATLRATQDLLRRMRDAGYVDRRCTQLDIDMRRGRGGSAPRVHSLTTAGYRLGQRSPGLYGSVIPRTGSRRRSEVERPMRLLHDLHVVGWWQAFESALALGVSVRDVLTPRYDDGVLTPPRLPIGRAPGSRPVELRDVILPSQYAFAGISDEPFTEKVKPDLTIQLEIFGRLVGHERDISVDLLVEVDRTKSAAKNRGKFARYDAFLTGWGLLHPRVEQLGTRPIVIFTSPDLDSMMALMKAADEVMTGRVGWIGDPEHAWYFPGRDHVLFTIEDEIHRGSMLACRLPEFPRDLRDRLCYEGFPRTVVNILPPELTPRAVSVALRRQERHERKDTAECKRETAQDR